MRRLSGKSEEFGEFIVHGFGGVYDLLTVQVTLTVYTNSFADQV